MIVTIHQPEHLPWLGFFDKMRQADVFVLLDTTQFAKDDFQNRNRIKTANGVKWLTVPIYKKGRSTQRILDAEIVSDGKWANRCWQNIAQNYRNAPYFADHKSFFRELYRHKWERLLDLNVAIITYLAQELGITTEIVCASDLGVYERGATAVNLTICETLGADVYLSGKFGRTYLNEPLFVEKNIAVTYQDFHHPTYSQLWGEFEPYMSTIDLLFNCGPDALDIITEANEVVVATL